MDLALMTGFRHVAPVPIECVVSPVETDVPREKHPLLGKIRPLEAKQ